METKSLTKYEASGKIVFEDKNGKPNKLIKQSTTLFFSLAGIYFVFSVITSLIKGDYRYAFIAIGVLFLGSLTVTGVKYWLYSREAKQAYYRITSDGIEIGVGARTAYVPFNSMVFAGPAAKADSDSTPRFEPVDEIRVFSRLTDLSGQEMWSIIFRDEETNSRLFFYPPYSFTYNLIKSLKKRRLENIISGVPSVK